MKKSTIFGMHGLVPARSSSPPRKTPIRLNQSIAKWREVIFNTEYDGLPAVMAVLEILEISARNERTERLTNAFVYQKETTKNIAEQARLIDEARIEEIISQSQSQKFASPFSSSPKNLVWKESAWIKTQYAQEQDELLAKTIEEARRISK